MNAHTACYGVATLWIHACSVTAQGEASKHVTYTNDLLHLGDPWRPERIFYLFIFNHWLLSRKGFWTILAKPLVKDLSVCHPMRSIWFLETGMPEWLMASPALQTSVFSAGRWNVIYFKKCVLPASNWAEYINQSKQATFKFILT